MAATVSGRSDLLQPLREAAVTLVLILMLWDEVTKADGHTSCRGCGAGKRCRLATWSGIASLIDVHLPSAALVVVCNKKLVVQGRPTSLSSLAGTAGKEVAHGKRDAAAPPYNVTFFEVLEGIEVVDLACHFLRCATFDAMPVMPKGIVGEDEQAPWFQH